jgi:hypothetical protein
VLATKKEKPFRVFFLREWLDAFRTVNWLEVKRELGFSGVSSIFSREIIYN